MTEGGQAQVEGLTAAEVAQRVADGLVNDVPARATRSVRDIVVANVATRINAILLVLLVLVAATGSVIDGMFGLLIVANSVVGIVQEVRAKRTLDRLAIVGQAQPTVRREGVAVTLPQREVVRDDVVELRPGDQIVVDGTVIAAQALEIDESLLTGEADPIDKAIDAEVLSGSFVVSGVGAYRATRVGRHAYAARLVAEASAFTLVRSELRSGIDTILKVVGYLLIPAGLVTMYNQLIASHQDWRSSVNGMVGALVPMVPEGLVLLTSVAFAVGVVRLGRRRCLVQELPAIEGLARVDVVCTDKTGTLTEGGMRLADVHSVGDVPERLLQSVLAALAAADPAPNASMAAIAQAFPDNPGWQPTAVAAFSSATKWSGVTFAEHGTWLLGAPDVLLDEHSVAAEQAQKLSAEGLRVLLLARGERPADDPDAATAVTAQALVVLEQRVRADAAATLRYFQQQQVDIKVVSGDSAAAVAAVAGKLELAGAAQAVDARHLPTGEGELAEVVQRTSLFGRVRPDQKRAMVTALHSRGHTVAMTGDGVNDVLALRDADIGVAMGSGSPATRAVAQLVLLDDSFATLPYVVAEGRRVIGNIERVSSLFLTKTVYSVLLALLVGVVGIGAQVVHGHPLPYPFLPRHVTIVAWFTIGVPAFVLSLAPNAERARAGMVARVLRLAVPAGIGIGASTFTVYLVAYRGVDQTTAQRVQASTAALLTLLIVAVWVLAMVARPWTWWKLLIVAACGACYLVLFATPLARRIFLLDPSNPTLTAAAALAGLVGIALVWLGWRISGWRPARA